ncbi:hypothetical protein [Sphaerisporangium krabiense]|uniref:Abortive infection protein n=1 Tax=Sphaerisporangium krabiense TaxID=763782 RepID=A0A7W8Z801_9ACTN|nr:hypothetical protein [Sphaerisporangium krabiense]MBB5629010.1 hypothetical protein [Sphaerisporangium krabiense]
MRVKGINYDTGFLPGGTTSRENFDPATVRREMRVIAEDLHCGAVRVSGGLPERLEIAARHAAGAGLEVWFSPFPCEMGPAEMLPYFADCARRAEKVRAEGAEVVLVLGCELSLFGAGWIPGPTYKERIAYLSGIARRPWRLARLARVPRGVNAFLAEAAAVAREHFGGRVTYASGPWERVDWTPFDIVSVDSYRDRRTASTYAKTLRRHFRHGKPVVVTEFGTCAYEGAADRGGMAWAVVDRSREPHRLAGDLRREESEQVTYLRELLPVFEAEGVDAAFWFTFASYGHPHREDPRYDLDLASYGVVKVLEDRMGTTYPDMAWEPKEVFHAMADAYRA